MTTPPLMVIGNRHTGSGEPPGWVGDMGVEGQRFYFENVHGEQWVALLTGKRLVVTGGDIGWVELEVRPEGLSAGYRGLRVGGAVSSPGPASFCGQVLGRNEVGWFLGLLMMAEHLWGVGEAGG